MPPIKDIKGVFEKFRFLDLLKSTDSKSVFQQTSQKIFMTCNFETKEWFRASTDPSVTGLERDK